MFLLGKGVISLIFGRCQKLCRTEWSEMMVSRDNETLRTAWNGFQWNPVRNRLHLSTVLVLASSCQCPAEFPLVFIHFFFWAAEVSTEEITNKVHTKSIHFFFGCWSFNRKKHKQNPQNHRSWRGCSRRTCGFDPRWHWLQQHGWWPPRTDLRAGFSVGKKARNCSP